MMSEKQGIEKGTAESFLRLYNARTGSAFTIIEHSDSPDLHCRDSETGASLNLEVTLLEDVPGDTQHILGRGPSRGVRNFLDHTVATFSARLAAKCCNDYGPDVALVMRQVSPLWTAIDWDIYREDFQAVIPPKCKTAFQKGIWILTWEDDSSLDRPHIIEL